MIERLAISWEDGLFAVVAALAWLSASFVSCPQVSVQFVSKAGVEITAAIPWLGHDDGFDRGRRSRISRRRS